MKGNAQPLDFIRQTNGHGEKLSRKAEQAIIALLAHPTISEAAKACGLSETTLWRWLQRDDFQKLYRNLQTKMVDNALASLQGATGEAIGTLKRNLACGKPEAENRAAIAILELTLKTKEIFELQDRMKELENRLKDREEANAFGDSIV